MLGGGKEVSHARRNGIIRNRLRTSLFAEAFYVVLEKSPLLHQIAKENDIELTPQTNVTEVLAHHAIKDICTVHEDYCTGDDRQYSR